MYVPIVICAVSIMRQSKTDLAGTVAVRMRGSDRWTGVRVSVTVAKAVAVRRCREMTLIVVRIHEVAFIVTAGRRNVVVILAAVTLNITFYLNEDKDA